MLIGEVMDRTKLTRRAIRYYEEEGLINPKVDHNRYRYFESEDIDRLKEISILRFNGFSIDEIKSLIDSEYKLQGLERIKNINDLKIREYMEKNKSIERLQDDYNVESEFERQLKVSKSLTVKEKLLEAFPITYISHFIISIFDKYLDVEIESKEQGRAYEDIIEYLDGQEIEELPEELKAYIENMYIANGADKMKSIQDNLLAYMNNLDAYRLKIEENKDDFKKQSDYFKSEEYKTSELNRFVILVSEYMEKIDMDYIEDRIKIINPDFEIFVNEFEETILEINKINDEN